MQIKIFEVDDIENKLKTKKLYKECFDEGKDEYIDYYYDVIIKRNVVIAMVKNDTIISMVHLNPYLYNILNLKATIYYLVAVATVENERHKGYMKLVMDAAIEYMKSKKIPMCYIVPDSDKLEDTYNKFGFTTLCDFNIDKFSKNEYDIYPVLTEEYKFLMDKEQYYLDLETQEYKDELASKKVMFRLIDTNNFVVKNINELKNKRIYVCQEV